MFNGERMDTVTGNYHPGNGYRSYHPSLMRFSQPDSWSPFGMGGINAYAWCAGDPVNHSDNSGHMSWQDATGIIAGVIGLALVPFTLGESLTVSSCIIAGLDTVSATTAIASGALDTSRPAVSAALGWVSFATGLLSLGSGFASGLIQAGNRVPLTTWSWENIHNIGILAPSWRETSPEAVYYFEDLHRGQPRLSIVGHAQFMPEEATAGVAVLDDLIFQGRDLAMELEETGYDFRRVTHIRAIMCHSAEGGIPGNTSPGSLAAQIAGHTGLPTTGYLGKVTTYGILDDYADDYFRLASSEHPGADIMHNFQDIRTRADALINHAYRTHLPGQLFSNARAMFKLVRRGMHYEPRTFIPRPDGTFGVLQRAYP
jgi:RHS repeat-associated protein